MAPRTGLATRDKLLDAAVRTFRERGYAATKVEDLCAATGLTKGAFFHHFDSKEALALASIEHFDQRAATLFAAAPYRWLADPRARVQIPRNPVTQRIAQEATLIDQIGTVFVPIDDQDRALAFYVDKLGFAKRVDARYGAGRWLEVAPPGLTRGPVPTGRGG